MFHPIRPREIERLRVGSRCRRNQSDARSRLRERRERGDRFQCAGRDKLRAIAEYERIGEKYGIEQALLGPDCEIAKIVDIGQRLARRAGMTPACIMMAASVNEEV